SCDSLRSQSLLFALPGSRTERLDLFGVVTVYRDSLNPELPRLGIGAHDLFDRALFRHVDGLGNSARDEGLYGGHHLHVAHIVDRSRAVLRAETAIEYREVLGLQIGRAFDRAGGIDVADDLLYLLRRVAELDQCGGDRVVDDFDHASAHELLVFD